MNTPTPTASTTGHGTNIITGISVGMKSTCIPTLIITVSVLLAYHLGRTSGLGSGHNSGLFGTAVATMGMLSTACYILSMNNYGPIADNAGGIAEMSMQPEHVRDATDRLDAAGNVTKAVSEVCGGRGALFFNEKRDRDFILLTSSPPFPPPPTLPRWLYI